MLEHTERLEQMDTGQGRAGLQRLAGWLPEVQPALVALQATAPEGGGAWLHMSSLLLEREKTKVLPQFVENPNTLGAVVHLRMLARLSESN